jgi:hypothetical protein
LLCGAATIVLFRVGYFLVACRSPNKTYKRN